MTDDCIIWTGATNGRYGVRTVKQKRHYSHHFAYAQAFGPIPEGMDVCHSCDNPLCVNPNHLFTGTKKDNMRDCSLKGRYNHKGEHNGNSKLTELEVRHVRNLRHIYGMTYAQISRACGVHETAIWNIISGDSWSHVV